MSVEKAGMVQSINWPQLLWRKVPEFSFQRWNTRPPGRVREEEEHLGTTDGEDAAGLAWLGGGGGSFLCTRPVPST